MLGEDIQDNQGPVHDLQIQLLLQAAQLGRGQLIIADDAVRVQFYRQLPDLVDLAAADIGARMHTLPVLDDPAYGLRACGVGQFLKLVQGLLHIFIFPGADADENNPLPGRFFIFV